MNNQEIFRTLRDVFDDWVVKLDSLENKYGFGLWHPFMFGDVDIKLTDRSWLVIMCEDMEGIKFLETPWDCGRTANLVNEDLKGRGIDNVYIGYEVVYNTTQNFSVVKVNEKWYKLDPTLWYREDGIKEITREIVEKKIKICNTPIEFMGFSLGFGHMMSVRKEKEYFIETYIYGGPLQQNECILLKSRRKTYPEYIFRADSIKCEQFGKPIDSKSIVLALYNIDEIKNKLMEEFIYQDIIRMHPNSAVGIIHSLIDYELLRYTEIKQEKFEEGLEEELDKRAFSVLVRLFYHLKNPIDVDIIDFEHPIDKSLEDILRLKQILKLIKLNAI